ncbi:MAG: GIY-YIG nuclease family protein [Eggerthellaceae bacterium]|nr:GIY-YIG nuclease family protein [Eggerthellaceae bacterium]
MGGTDVAWVYIMANERRTVLYVGVTNDLARRVGEHKSHLIEGFTARYNVDRLVYCEECQTMTDAIAREKQLKKWGRAKKVALIERVNPEWCDLAGE